MLTGTYEVFNPRNTAYTTMPARPHTGVTKRPTLSNNQILTGPLSAMMNSTTAILANAAERKNRRSVRRRLFGPSSQQAFHARGLAADWMTYIADSGLVLVR